MNFRTPSYICLTCRERDESGEWCPGHDEPRSSFRPLVIIDDIETDYVMSPEAQQSLAEWHRLQVESGNIGIGTIRLPEGDLFKSLFERADTES